MTTKTACPSCGKSLGIPDGGHGRRVRCPGCQASLQVEVSDDVTRLLSLEEISEVPEAPPKPARPKGSSGHSRHRRRAGAEQRRQAGRDRREIQRHKQALGTGRLWLGFVSFITLGLAALVGLGAMAAKTEEPELYNVLLLAGIIQAVVGGILLYCCQWAKTKPYPAFLTATIVYMLPLGLNILTEGLTLDLGLAWGGVVSLSLILATYGAARMKELEPERKARR